MVQLVFHHGKIESSCLDCGITIEIHTKCIISKMEIPCSPVRLYGMTRWATVTGVSTGQLKHLTTCAEKS